MSVFSSAGVKISIGGAVAPTAVPVLADYTGATWTEIKEVVDISEFGDETKIVEFLSITDARTRKVKGSKDAGAITLMVGRDPIDLGQVGLRTASAAVDARLFKVELTDKPAAGASPKNTVVYFAALVTSARNTIGSVDDVTQQGFNLAITTALTEVVASGT